MNKKDLKELRALKKELRVLTKAYLDSEILVADTTKWSEPEHGIERVIKLQGYINSPESKRLAKRIREITQQRIAKINELEDYLETIDDADVRSAMRLYYIDGWTLEEIANELCYSNHSVISKKISAYIK